MNQLHNIKELINRGEVEQAIEQLTSYIAVDSNQDKDEAYYLRGNAYRKKGDWKQALDNYQSAIELNPESPATHARKMVMDILNFYNKDMYNQ